MARETHVPEKHTHMALERHMQREGEAHIRTLRSRGTETHDGMDKAREEDRETSREIAGEVKRPTKESV